LREYVQGMKAEWVFNSRKSACRNEKIGSTRKWSFQKR
jgi:hypothetical protein